jgi:hypothetical protein
MALVTNIDHLREAISDATAPAFMLGAVAGFLSILVSRLERVVDRGRTLRAADAAIDPSGILAAAFSRQMFLLSRAIYFAVLSALTTAALLIGAFLTAIVGIGHGRIVAVLFMAALALLMASLVVWSQPLMEHSCRAIRRMRYGPGSTRERHDD